MKSYYSTKHMKLKLIVAASCLVWTLCVAFGWSRCQCCFRLRCIWLVRMSGYLDFVVFDWSGCQGIKTLSYLIGQDVTTRRATATWWRRSRCVTTSTTDASVATHASDSRESLRSRPSGRRDSEPEPLQHNHISSCALVCCMV